MVNVYDLMTSRGYRLVKCGNKSGGEYSCECPGCGGGAKSDRFRVWPQQNDGNGSYWCRHECYALKRPTKKKCDSIQLLRDFFGYSFHEACAEVGRELGKYNKPKDLSKPFRDEYKWEASKREVPMELWQEKAQKFVEKAHENLLKENPALDWLAGRGIDIKTVKNNMLGWNPGEKNRKTGIVGEYFRAGTGWGVSETREDNKVKSIWIPKGLIIPCFVDGKVYRIRVRRTKKDLDELRKKGKRANKYIIVLGSKGGPMVLGADRKAFVIVEAELDAMAVFQAAGDLVGVVALGSLAAKPDNNTDQMLKSGLRILNALDIENDPVKMKRDYKHHKWWEENFNRCRRWPVPAGKDPGEAYTKGHNLRQWVIEGLPLAMTIDNENEKPEKVEKTKSAKIDQNKDISAKVLLLNDLLKKYPVMIRNSPDALEILYPDENWRETHYDESRKIQKLVFDFSIVMNYIQKHTASLIDGDNLIQGEKNGD
jgi:hypothetical protein